MPGQASLTDETNSLGLQVETRQAALSYDDPRWRSSRFLWTGLGFAVILLLGALPPLASHASLDPSHSAPALAISFLPALSPRGTFLAGHAGRHPPAVLELAARETEGYDPDGRELPVQDAWASVRAVDPQPLREAAWRQPQRAQANGPIRNRVPNAPGGISQPYQPNQHSSHVAWRPAQRARSNGLTIVASNRKALREKANSYAPRVPNAPRGISQTYHPQHHTSDAAWRTAQNVRANSHHRNALANTYVAQAAARVEQGRITAVEAALEELPSSSPRARIITAAMQAALLERNRIPAREEAHDEEERIAAGKAAGVFSGTSLRKLAPWAALAACVLLAVLTSSWRFAFRRYWASRLQMIGRALQPSSQPPLQMQPSF